MTGSAAASGVTSGVVFLHPSDERYGADRMLLTVLDALPADVPAEVWLPTDLAHPPSPLCRLLDERGIAFRHTAVPVLRRAYRTPAGLARLAGRVRATTRELRARAPRAVYCTSSAVLPGAWSARRAGVADVVVHVQEIWQRSDALVLTPLAARCDRVIAISEAVRDALPPQVSRRAVVVVNATEDPGPTPGPAGRTGPLNFLIASRWNGWKGHRTLLRAWELAGCPGTLTVLGGPPPSGESVDVPALVGLLPEPDSVDIVGEVDDVRPHLAAADVVLVPSDAPEPFGLVAIEAFAAGRPVVASAGGGLLGIVRDGVSGWTFPPGDAEALAGLLRSLTRERVEAAATRARAQYEAEYTVEQYRVRWRQALADVL